MTTLVEPPSAAAPRRRRSRRWARLVLRSLIVLVVALVAYVGITFIQVHRASQHDGARTAIPGAFDAVIVLGAAQYDGRPSPVLQDRLDHALELYEQDLADHIVLTGGRQEGDRFTEATAGYNYLRQRGVPDDALLKEVQGKNTWESLRASARFLEERGLTKVVLVTDDYHAFRVAAIADDIGLDATVSPSESRLSSGSQLRHLARETVAVAVGRVIGYDRLFRIATAVDA